MKMTRIESGLLQRGDVMKLKSNVKATPVESLIGTKVEDLKKYVLIDFPDFEGFFRPKEKKDECK